MEADNDDLAEPVLPPDATPAMRKFARHIAAALDYNAEDCSWVHLSEYHYGDPDETTADFDPAWRDADGPYGAGNLAYRWAWCGCAGDGLGADNGSGTGDDCDGAPA